MATEVRDDYLIGVDTGGTFTDCVIVNSDGSILANKSPSTPPNYDEGVLNSVGVTAEMVRGCTSHAR